MKCSICGELAIEVIHDGAPGQGVGLCESHISPFYDEEQKDPEADTADLLQRVRAATK